MGDLFDMLDIDGDGKITQKEFVKQGRELAPLCTEVEMEKCFEILDYDKSKTVNRHEFDMVFQGMVFHPNNPAAEEPRRALLRVSMLAEGGQSTMERWSRKCQLPRKVRALQTAWRRKHHRMNSTEASPSATSEDSWMVMV